jgi:hypothetical protein
MIEGQNEKATAYDAECPETTNTADNTFGSSNNMNTCSEPSQQDQQAPIPSKECENDAFKNLLDHEADILRKQVSIPKSKISYWTLFQYASNCDKFILAASVLCTIGAGSSMPLMTVRFTHCFDHFLENN